MKNSSTSSKAGCCYLVGAGPGDPGLLTLRAKECLEKAEIVFYDYLSNPAFLAYAPTTAKTTYVGKISGRHALPQEEINQCLVEATRSGKQVVRLKGGDPFLFGRGGEEAEALAEAGLPFEVIPGITSPIAGAAYAGIPVTHRANNSQVTFFTGHQDPSKESSSIDYHQLAKTPGTKVMLMGIERLEAITTSLQEGGMDPQTPVILVRWATTSRQESLEGTLATIASLAQAKNFRAPAIAIFGEVVSLRQKLSWFEKKPLLGKKIIVTRTRKQSSSLLQGLQQLGADAYEIPTIKIVPPTTKEEKATFQEIITYAHHYDWIIFTSPNAVEIFMESFFEKHQDARELGHAQIAAIGPSTAAKIHSYHLGVNLMPTEYVAESLLKAFEEINVENLRILLPRAAGARELLATALEEKGAIVDDVPIYQTLPETEDITGGVTRLMEEGADMITFTSGSTAKNFVALMKELGHPIPSSLAIASIGPVTSQTLEGEGLPPTVEAQEHHIPGLLAAIQEYYATA